MARQRRKEKWKTTKLCLELIPALFFHFVKKISFLEVYFLLCAAFIIVFLSFHSIRRTVQLLFILNLVLCECGWVALGFVDGLMWWESFFLACLPSASCVFISFAFYFKFLRFSFDSRHFNSTKRINITLRQKIGLDEVLLIQTQSSYSFLLTFYSVGFFR